MGAVTHDPALQQETEVWFVRHGLPWFVPGEREAARAALTACAEVRPGDALARRWLDELRDPAFRGEFRLDGK